MRYVIKCDDYVLHDSRSQTLKLSSPKLNLELNKNGTLTFTIYNNHPYYEKINKLKSVISVYQDNKILFKGRILDDTMNIYKSKNVTVEGIRAYLLDSVYRPFEYQGDIPEFLESIIESHNSQVEDFQKFKLGNITVTDPNNYINRSSIEYLTSLEVIESRLIKTHGGYLIVRYEDDGNYLDYLSDFPYTSTQIVEFSVNIADLSQKVDGTSIKTGVIPLGAKLQDSEGNDTDERLTIKSVNNDKDYLIDEESSKLYGKIFEVVTWDDVTLPQNLLTKAQRYLADNIMFLLTLDVSAIDLSTLNKDINSFRLGEYIRIKSSPHDINKIYLLKKLSIDIENPAKTQIQLGDSFKSLTDISVGQSSTSNDLITRIGTIETHYVPNKELTGIVNEKVETNSFIRQMPENILFQVSENYTKQSDFNEYQNKVSTQFLQTKNDFTMQFTELISQINGMDGETKQQFNEIIKYIRFVDGSIILGQVDNSLLLKISNDRISFISNNLEIAYMSGGRLYITDGEFLNSLQLGNFTFEPRSNGNLSFYKNRR